MVLCIVAMVVFGILGIFSIRYRTYAKEAMECTFRMVTLRPCQSDFDQKMKTQILAKLMRFPKIANFTNKHFKAISVVIVVLFLGSIIASGAYAGYGVYNLVAYGTCDPQHPENCVFTPLLKNGAETGEIVCQIKMDFVEFYGEECPHCIKMKSIVAGVEQETGITIQKLEVWHDNVNANTMRMHAANITKSCGDLGVPAFYAVKTGNAVCGEISKQVLRDFISDNS